MQFLVITENLLFIIKFWSSPSFCPMTPCYLYSLTRESMKQFYSPVELKIWPTEPLDFELLN